MVEIVTCQQTNLKINNELLKLIKKHFNTQRLPPLDKIYVALKNNEIVGTFTIEDNDLPGYKYKGKELQPWLADLVIVPEYRGMGLSYKLIDKFIEIIGNKDSYCWCSNSNYFNIFISCGFEIIDKYHDKTIFMKKMKS